MAAFSTLALIGLSATGTYLSARASMRAGDAEARAGDAQRRVAEAQADLAESNAGIAELQAADALARGHEDESRFRASVRAMVGSVTASAAAANVDVTFGSPVDVRQDVRYLGELDALTIRTNATREAWGYRVEAEDLRRRATIARQEGEMLAEAGREARAGSRWQAAGTIIAGGESLLASRYGFTPRRRA